jgi:DNA-binding NtrC family response regulator
MIRARILVVDDEPQIRCLLRSLLSREGYQVTEAGDGMEALTLCEQGSSFDLLLTDIVMPRMDGLQLSERISSLIPAVRVLYMSGRCEVEKVARHVEQFGFGFIKKPFEIQELSASVRNQLRTGRPRRSRRRIPRAAGARPPK